MASAIPCPNPTCTHQFSAPELQAAAHVLCPKCGFRMQGQGKASAAPPKPAPAKPAPAKPAPPAKAPAVKSPAPAKPAPVAASNPCPNPTCTHQFSVADLQSAAQIQCPRCGFRFPGKGKPSVAPALEIPAPKPAAAPVPLPEASPIAATPILAAPVDPAEPMAAPIPNDALFSPREPSVRPTQSKSNAGCLRIVLMLVGLGFALSIIVTAAVLAVVFWPSGLNLTKGATGPDEVSLLGPMRNKKGVEENVFQLSFKRKEWISDDEIAPRFGTRFAWKHRSRDVWLAIVVQDFETYRPRDADLLRTAIDKLNGHFKDGLELGEKAIPVRANGLAMQKLQFKGQLNASSWLGECYIFFHHGVAYWMFISSPDWDQVEEWATAFTEKNFKVESDRRGWREQPAPTETFKSINESVALTVPKGVWEKQIAKDTDENGELLLVGRYQEEKDNRKNAVILVFTQPAKENLKDATTAVREYLDKDFKNRNEKYRFLLAEGKAETGEVVDVGNKRGTLVDLKLVLTDDEKAEPRYFLLAVINEKEKVYAVRCECLWESRQIWRQEFLEILRTLKIQNID